MAKGSSSAGESSAGMRRSTRRLLAAAAAFLLLVSVAYLWLAASLDAAAIERLINRAIVPASGGIYEISIDQTAVSLLSRSVWIGGAELRYVPEAVGAAAERGESPGFLVQVRVGAFQLQGVRILPLLMRRAFIARSLEVDSAQIAAILRLDVLGGPGAPDAAPDGRSIEQRAAAALAGTPEVRVESIRLRDAGGTIAVHRGTQRERIDRLGGLELAVDGLHIHEGATVEEIGRLYSDDFRLQVREFALADRFSVREMELSTGQRFIRLAGVVLQPERTVPDYLSRPTVREPDRVAVSAGDVTLSGLDPTRALALRELAAETIELSSFRVEILHDRHKPGKEPRAQPQPHDLIGALPFRVRVDTIRLDDGYVAYSERAPKAQRPGTISFEQIAGTIRGLDTGVGELPEETRVPVVADLETSIMGAGHTTLSLTLPLWDPAPTMQVQGRIDAFDATTLNGILTPLLGVEVSSGRIDSAAFDIAYVPGRATGNMDVFYRDASLRLTDRNYGGQNLGNRILSFAANALGVHDANPSRPGQAPRPGPIDVAFDDTWPFFKLLWVPIREALLDVLRKI